MLAASALFSLFTSWSSVSQPSIFGHRLGLSVEDPDGSNEIRAQYGGFFLALAVLDALALTGIVRRDTSFVTNAAVSGGLIVGRLTSLFMGEAFGAYGNVIVALFFIDGVGFALSTICLLWERRGFQGVQNGS